MKHSARFPRDSLLPPLGPSRRSVDAKIYPDGERIRQYHALKPRMTVHDSQNQDAIMKLLAGLECGQEGRATTGARVRARSKRVESEPAR